MGLIGVASVVYEPLYNSCIESYLYILQFNVLLIILLSGRFIDDLWLFLCDNAYSANPPIFAQSKLNFAPIQ